MSNCTHDKGWHKIMSVPCSFCGEPAQESIIDRDEDFSHLETTSSGYDRDEWKREAAAAQRLK